VYDLFIAGSAGQHHFYWRELFFGSVLVTLGAVTKIKTRDQDPESVNAS